MFIKYSLCESYIYMNYFNFFEIIIKYNKLHSIKVGQKILKVKF